ncbi:MAG TPA: GNAT family N-acetyltransferase [Candidatus Sulfotelmatobacter sp.]|nr:GNAT family N-acetyltransferase [Candidatus Sulfotelmatobacter sp.]
MPQDAVATVNRAAMANEVRENAAAGRFELVEDGALVFANYRRQGDRVIVPHVEAAPRLRGTGAADRLMLGIMQLLRAEGARIVPLCSYAAAWMRRHKEYHDLLG